MTKKATSVPNHPWDRAATSVLIRTGSYGRQEKVDPGANFFVLALEALGATPRFSCEGHPYGFYVAFEAPYELALEINAAGHFTVEISGKDYWAIRKERSENAEAEYTEADKQRSLRWATEAWIRAFGGRLSSMDCFKEAA